MMLLVPYNTGCNKIITNSGVLILITASALLMVCDWFIRTRR